jgi:hypothetical protein
MQRSYWPVEKTDLPFGHALSLGQQKDNFTNLAGGS